MGNTQTKWDLGDSAAFGHYNTYDRDVAPSDCAWVALLHIACSLIRSILNSI
jgi:hypothetical protein